MNITHEYNKIDDPWSKLVIYIEYTNNIDGTTGFRYGHAHVKLGENYYKSFEVMTKSFAGQMYDTVDRKSHIAEVSIDSRYMANKYYEGSWLTNFVNITAIYTTGEYFGIVHRNNECCIIL